jgi:hypothetical protein
MCTVRIVSVLCCAVMSVPCTVCAVSVLCCVRVRVMYDVLLMYCVMYEHVVRSYSEPDVCVIVFC